MVCSPPPRRSTPSMVRRLEPMPEMRAPRPTRNRHRSRTWGSQAALPITVLPSARTAAMMAFSVAVTDASSRNIDAPRSRPTSSSRARSKRAWTPRERKASRWVSSRRRPITSPPGGGSRQWPVLATSGAASSTDARMRVHRAGSRVGRRRPRGSMRTWLGAVRSTLAPVEATSSSMVSTSRIWGTLCSTTGSSASRQAATMGSAAFLFPDGRMVPLSGCPPLMTKLSMTLPARGRSGHGRLLYRYRISVRSSSGHDGCPSRLVHWWFRSSFASDHGEFPPMPAFKLVSDMPAAGDQPAAIDAMVEALAGGEQGVTLLGVTGSGKTRSMAGVIERINRPALVMAPNKTLAAQLTNEFKELFPDNAVEYFVSYYDYYQPEAYIPQTDTYIEKDSSMNEEIDRLRHSATLSLLTRRDVIVVASVSAIYGLGSPQEYRDQMLWLKRGESYDRDGVLRKLVDIYYDRNDLSFVRGKFRVRGDTLEVFPAYEERAMRLEFFGDEVERILVMDPVTGEIVGERDELYVFPATH